MQHDSIVESSFGSLLQYYRVAFISLYLYLFSCWQHHSHTRSAAYSCDDWPWRQTVGRLLQGYILWRHAWERRRHSHHGHYRWVGFFCIL